MYKQKVDLLSPVRAFAVEWVVYEAFIGFCKRESSHAFYFTNFFFHRRGVLFISANQPLINDEIREKSLRIIGPDNEQLGIMSSDEALKKAEEDELDLVLIAPLATPPVARIMNYGKYRFEQVKKEKEAKKNQKTVELKEIKMTVNIDTNDFNIKLAQAIKFLNGGDKVKVTIRYRRARELSHTNLGEELMKRFLQQLAEYGTNEKPSKLEGKNYAVVVSPKAVPVPVKKKPKSTEEEQN